MDAILPAAFEDVSLAGADLQGANLQETVFTECQLSRVRLNNARLEQTVFNQCEMAGLQATDTRLTETVMNQCELTGSDFSRCALFTTQFMQCAGTEPVHPSSVRPLHLFESPLEACRFDNCKSLLTTFYGIDLRQTALTAGEFERTVFFNCDQRGKITKDSASPAAGSRTARWMTRCSMVRTLCSATSKAHR